ncbi:hypothetical protein CF326_g8154 [Tilletia indica]|nr:hypothetical protein CF326_g8154 [Tilletia indica]
MSDDFGTVNAPSLSGSSDPPAAPAPASAPAPDVNISISVPLSGSNNPSAAAGGGSASGTGAGAKANKSDPIYAQIKTEGPDSPSAYAGVAPGGKVRLTSYPAIQNAPLPAEGNGSFDNLHLALLVLFTPAILLRIIPFVKASWVPWWLYFVLVLLTGVPVVIAYWTVMSMIGPRKNEKVALPGRPLEYYMDIKDPELKKKYHGNTKIPMQIFHDAYFAQKIDIKLDIMELLEFRWDWASMYFTPELFRYVFFNFIPDVLMHTARQDETQVRDTYDRGNDFYEWFLGPQMIYTSGIITDVEREETLEELQDNKLALVCAKLALKPSDTVLDIGCGWGTFTAFAAKNFGCDVTGVTLAKEQAAFGNERIKKAGVDPSKARILCLDYRDIPQAKGKYTKIVTLEMAEHVGVRHYGKFLANVYDLLDDDGLLLFQVAGLRPQWQFWDIIWGLFMNKYVFPGADASLHVGWVITQLEKAGFEVRSCDVLGVHYSATIDRWLKNWKANEDKVKGKYGEKWWRVWLYFLASSVIIAREGGSSLFQITLHKNLNAFHRVEGVLTHGNIHPKPPREFVSVYK